MSATTTVISAAHFPTPDLAVRAGVDVRRVRGFAHEQATAARDIHGWLSDSGLGRSVGERTAAVKTAYAQAVTWRYRLAQAGAIVGGVGAVDGGDAERFRTPITDTAPNVDRIGPVGRFRDGSAWDPDARAYLGGTETPASLVTAAYGRAALARFEAEAPEADVLDNLVRLPFHSRPVFGNRLLRGAAAVVAGRGLAERVAARGLDASRMEIGGDPVYVVTAAAADRDRIRANMFALLADHHIDLSTWWQAVYLAYQAPMCKKGSDAVNRVFLAAVAAWRLDHCPTIPQDVDLRAMVLGQSAATTLPHVCGRAA
ncbi:hypothetical protein [Actinokineospora iranica]|uniref:Uncharacterized protein n=1 Tax=Actinokineospora iranica TaxID=1271860 RepID=A0A1G6WRQ3_9PSEU|nr:hypothetical protein [Actinokineospora iranica]SDD68343.1 hypothetical protein SAMN05216174_115134 [Actinokineospora iranica]